MEVVSSRLDRDIELVLFRQTGCSTPLLHIITRSALQCHGNIVLLRRGDDVLDNFFLRAVLVKLLSKLC